MHRTSFVIRAIFASNQSTRSQWKRPFTTIKTWKINYNRQKWALLPNFLNLSYYFCYLYYCYIFKIAKLLAATPLLFMIKCKPLKQSFTFFFNLSETTVYITHKLSFTHKKKWQTKRFPQYPLPASSDCPLWTLACQRQLINF